MANARVADAILRLAQEGSHKVFWTRRILDSMARVQRKNGWQSRIVDNLQARLAEVFSGAVISGHERWIEQCTNDDSDRHVLACAIEAGARYIVTFNTDDFKDADLEPWNVRAMKPNDYLLMLYLRNEALFEEHFTQAAIKKGKTAREIATGLLRDCRSFAELILKELPKEQGFI